jgi:hypothetical protein
MKSYRKYANISCKILIFKILSIDLIYPKFASPFHKPNGSVPEHSALSISEDPVKALAGDYVLDMGGIDMDVLFFEPIGVSGTVDGKMGMSCQAIDLVIFYPILISDQPTFKLLGMFKTSCFPGGGSAPIFKYGIWHGHLGFQGVHIGRWAVTQGILPCRGDIGTVIKGRGLLGIPGMATYQGTYRDYNRNNIAIGFHYPQIYLVFRDYCRIFRNQGTCKMHGVEPYTWFKEVLQKIADHPINKIHDLLPHRYKI